MKKTTLIIAMLLATGCKDNQSATVSEKPTEAAPATQADIPSIHRQLACLPKSAAFVAAHRGTSKKDNLAENSGSSLKKLIKEGILFAEIDVAGLSDGTHILFHDGVWDEKSTGKGTVASTSWGKAQNFLLKDTDGDFSADRPIKLDDVLALSKDQLYLEVDFKSSAKYKTVIQMIRDADMSDQVILISYNIKQARRLAKLAPEMMLSVAAKSEGDIADLKSAGVKLENIAVWLGKGPYDKGYIAYLDEKSIPVLAWPRERDRKKSWGPATVAVTDYALQKKPIEGLSRSDKVNYETCLNK